MPCGERTRLIVCVNQLNKTQYLAKAVLLMRLKICKQGFTLIEISIVLVIIGLIVGGVLVGRSLILSAAINAQIAQIAKYNAAVNTFSVKYNNELPGDITANNAQLFGLTARSGIRAQGDGNRVLEGYWGSAGCGRTQGAGETVMFWVDLASARLIDGNFVTATPGTYITSDVTGTNLALYFPKSKIGDHLYLFAASGGPGQWCGGGVTDNINYYTLSSVTNNQATPTPGVIISSPGLKVAEAYAIDVKMDDGLPQAGHVLAVYIANNSYQWAAASGYLGANDTTATPATSLTCFDNNNIGGAIQRYSIGVNGGANVNCALSFKIQ